MDIKTKSLVKAFGSVIKLAEFYKIQRQTVYDWGDELPYNRRLQLKDRRPDIYDAIIQGEYDD